MSQRVRTQIMPGCRGRIATGELRRIAVATLKAQGTAAGVEVEVVLADAATVQKLNRLYRGADEATDVLSFAAADGGAFVQGPEEAPSLGEVIVCLPVAEGQALAAGRPVEGEIAHLLVHGLLHILGHDHEAEKDSAAMQQAEDALLEALGYAGQYAHGH